MEVAAQAPPEAQQRTEPLCSNVIASQPALPNKFTGEFVGPITLSGAAAAAGRAIVSTKIVSVWQVGEGYLRMQISKYVTNKLASKQVH